MINTTPATRRKATMRGIRPRVKWSAMPTWSFSTGRIDTLTTHSRGVSDSRSEELRSPDTVTHARSPVNRNWVTSTTP